MSSSPLYLQQDIIQTDSRRLHPGLGKPANLDPSIMKSTIPKKKDPIRCAVIQIYKFKDFPDLVKWIFIVCQK